MLQNLLIIFCVLVFVLYILPEIVTLLLLIILHGKIFYKYKIKKYLK